MDALTTEQAIRALADGHRFQWSGLANGWTADGQAIHVEIGRGLKRSHHAREDGKCLVADTPAQWDARTLAEDADHAAQCEAKLHKLEAEVHEAIEAGSLHEWLARRCGDLLDKSITLQATGEQPCQL